MSTFVAPPDGANPAAPTPSTPAKRPAWRAPLIFALAFAMVVSLVLAYTQRGRSGYDASTVALFERFGNHGALEEVEHYASIAETAKAADVVVVAKVAEITTTRTILDVQMIGMTIEPTEVLRGSLPPEFRRKLTVEFLGGSSSDVSAMNRHLPTGNAIWFLRSKAADGERIVAEAKRRGETLGPSTLAVMKADRPFYRLTSTQGLFVQGQGHVVDPLWSEDAGPGAVVDEAERFATLRELGEHITAGQ